MRRLEGQRGSALVEAAILFPCLVLILYWSIALTDVLVLKMKAAEGARFALWETTAWKSPPQIDGEVQRRFQDLRSPEGIERPTTGLLLYPRSSGILWRAQVDTAADEVKLAGNRIHASGGPAILGPFIGTAASWMASAVQTAMRSERFNTFGSASVRVRLLHARNDSSKVLAGGDLPGRKGGDDLGAPRSLRSLSLESPLGAERPMQLVFDTWKAWPRPAAYQLAGAPSDVGVPPQQTYPEVEKQVASQVDRIAFFGMKQQPWFAALDSAAARILGGAVTTTLLGGRPPSIFSTARMDSPDRGPITIRPAGPPQAAFVPNLCDTPGDRQQPCRSQRVGDVEAGVAKRLTGLAAYTEAEDVTRYTVPHAINSQYWRASGGTADGLRPSLLPMPSRIATANQYVQAWSCRGHFFAGATAAQEPDVARRYRSPCK